MRSLFLFTLASNSLAFVVVALSYFLIPALQNFKPIDLMFLTGVLFWLVSTMIRLSNKQVKKEWHRNEVITADPEYVIRGKSLAFQFLIAGLPGIVGAVVWGLVAY